METELTKAEKEIRELAENKNPYDNGCPNRHLWNEGFNAAARYIKHYTVSKSGHKKECQANHDQFIECKDKPYTGLLCGECEYYS